MRRVAIAAGRSLVALLIALLVLSAGADAGAQTFARRRVPRGEVTGLEMGIEGSLSAVPGGRVRWYVTLYEVLRRRDLRPSPGSTLEVTAAFAPGEPVAIVRTDAQGRAAIEIPIPEEVEGSTDIRVTAISPRNVRRVFSVALQLVPRYDVSLFVDRSSVPPGATITAFGRVMDRVTGRPVPAADVLLTAGADGSAPFVRDLTTDPSGVFSVLVGVGDRDGPIGLAASAGGRTTTTSAVVSTPDPPRLWVVARPEVAVAAPGENVDVVVRVRRTDGTPVVGARASFDDTPHRVQLEERDLPRTDGSGVVRLGWRVSRLTGQPFEERFRQITIVHPSIGSMGVSVHLRVARAGLLSAWSVEGGALVPELRGTVHVRLVAPDGTPLRGQAAVLEAPRLGGVLSGTTDADGVVSFDGRVASRGPTDDCGGPTATAATLVVGAHRERLCLPLDPDGTVALQVDDMPVSGSPIALRVMRRSMVRSAPVEVTVLARRAERWIPVARSVVPARADAVTIEAPPGVTGELWLRARPILGGGRAAHGGGVVVYLAPRPGGLSLDADGAGARVTGGENATVAVFAMDAGDEASLVDAVNATVGPVAAAIDRGRTEGFVRALLAARTPRDAAASVAIVGGEIVAQPLPENPVAHGLLRDPWRTRARFVRGRVGRMMRAVEDYADAQIPDDIEEVAVKERGRWRFNEAALEAALSVAGLGEETAAGLDGEPLDISALSQMDRAFTFDNVARRITRERLWRLMVMLREHVQHYGLDRPWARRGDPGEYLATLVEGEGFQTVWPERSHLFDGWGSPFVLRRARGGRARFSFLEPVPGWELVSAGPDGRPGTGDDVVDPFARVLSSSGMYAEAVGEDILLARLGGVALGRATVSSLAEVFEVDSTYEIEPVGGARLEAWRALPEPVAAPTTDPRLPPIAAPIGGVGDARPWSLSPERRLYSAVALRFGRDGSLETARDRFEAGVPWAAHLTLPTAMRPGEHLRLPVALVQLADAPRPTIEVSARGGAIEARYEEGEVSLRAVRPGMARVTVRMRVGDREVESFEGRVRVVPPGSLRARHSATITAPHAELSVTLPDDAMPWRAQLVLGAPRALRRDPLFAQVAELRPAIVAWAQALDDGEVEGELLAHVTRDFRAEDPMSDLEIACALTAWAVQEPEEGRAPSPLADAIPRLIGSIGDDLRTRAAVLAALATSAPGTAAGSAGPLAALLTQLRTDGWRALASAPDQPAVMARMAAALLLVDRRDAPGRVLLDRARAALTQDAHGRRWVPGDDGHAGDGWVGTLALAIAARQIGDDTLADELVRSAVGRLYLASRLGAEGAFWALAASAYGAFGVDAPEVVTVRIDGHDRRVVLEGGVATLSLPPSASIEVESDRPVWVRTESRYLVPFRDQEDAGSLRARLDGATGGFGERAALELVLHNDGDEAASAPVVEVTLPGAARLDDEARAAIEASSAVTRVDRPDGAGVVRLHFSPLATDATHRIPLPVLWIARGRTRGLAMSAYDASAPWDVAITEGRAFEITGGSR